MAKKAQLKNDRLLKVQQLLNAVVNNVGFSISKLTVFRNCSLAQTNYGNHWQKWRIKVS